MNVGVWASGLAPELGGVHTFETDVLEALAALAQESGHRFTVLLPDPAGPHRSVLSESGRLKIGSVPRLGTVERAAERLYADSSLFRYLWKRGSRVDAALRQLGVELLWFLSPFARRVDVPYLLPVWDLQHRLQPWFPEVASRNLWYDREAHFSTTLRRAAAVIVGTEAGRDEVERFYQVPRDRIRILPHPTPGFALDPAAGDGQEVLTRYGLPRGYLLYPAQFWPHKNHVNLLFAVRQVRDEDGLAVPLVFSGSDQGNRSHIDRLVDRLGLAAQVHSVGFVSQDDLVALYRNALALTYVSFFGPENLPPLEAFALGCPVIASDVPGAREQLGDAALLVDPRRPEQIAQTIRRLHQDAALRQTLVERGRARAVRWTARDFVKGVFAILDEFEPIRRCWGE